MISGLNYKLVCGFGSELHDTQWPQQNRSDSEISESDFDFCIMKMKMQVLLGSKENIKIHISSLVQLVGLVGLFGLLGLVGLVCLVVLMGLMGLFVNSLPDMLQQNITEE